MVDSAAIKIRRAVARVDELKALVQKKRPFSYIVETNTKTSKRATFAKRDEAVMGEVAAIFGDAVHNIRSALDHVYWEIVSPLATSDGERRLLQFPFVGNEARLEETLKQRLADRVSLSFYQALIDIKPHSGPDGNQPLWLINELDIIDKHKLLVPTGSFARISSEMLIEQVPDFPRGITNCGFGQGYRDVVWDIPPMGRRERRAAKIPDSGIDERELKVPVDMVFVGANAANMLPVIPTLQQLIEVATTTVSVIRRASNPAAQP